MVDRLAADSVLQVLGPAELDRVRLYAALLFEEGAVHELRMRGAEAERCYARARDLYRALAAAGVELRPADEERMARLDSERGRSL